MGKNSGFFNEVCPLKMLIASLGVLGLFVRDIFYISFLGIQSPYIIFFFFFFFFLGIFWRASLGLGLKNS
jgi:hypothetical protein